MNHIKVVFISSLKHGISMSDSIVDNDWVLLDVKYFTGCLYYKAQADQNSTVYHLTTVLAGNEKNNMKII